MIEAEPVMAVMAVNLLPVLRCSLIFNSLPLQSKPPTPTGRVVDYIRTLG